FLGQIGTVFGFAMQSRGITPRLIEFAGKLPQTHLPTLAVGLTTFAVIIGSKRLWPRAPAPLLATVAAVALVYGLSLEGSGVAVVGALPSGFASLGWRRFDPEVVKPLLGEYIGVALVNICTLEVDDRIVDHRGQ